MTFFVTVSCYHTTVPGRLGSVRHLTPPPWSLQVPSRAVHPGEIRRAPVPPVGGRVPTRTRLLATVAQPGEHVPVIGPEPGRRPIVPD